MKYIKYLFLTLILFIGINVYAEGPSSDGYIETRGDLGRSRISIFKNSTGENNVLDGISYDLSTNTLTLNNYTGVFRYEADTSLYDGGSSNLSYRAAFRFYNMNDVTVKLIGENNITCDTTFCYIFYYNENTNFTIEGPGTLTVSGSSSFDFLKSDGVNYANINKATINVTYTGHEIWDRKFVRGNFIGTHNYNAANININDSSITLNNMDSYNKNNGYSAKINNSEITLYNSEMSITEMEDTTINANISVLNVDKIKGSTINLLGPMNFGTPDGENIIEDSNIHIKAVLGLIYSSTPKALEIINSNIVIEKMSDGEREEFFAKNDDYNDNVKSLNIPFLSLSEPSLTDSVIVEGGSLYSGCGTYYGTNLCFYYIAEEEIPNFSESAVKLFVGDSLTSEDEERFAMLSTKVVIKDPRQEDPVEPDPDEGDNSVIDEIIKNVPNTGIFTIVGMVLGIGILSYGVYIVLKASNKETI